MTPEDHLRILGPEILAEIRLLVAAAPPPSAEVIAELQPILGPAYERMRALEALGAAEAA
ncbi:hypothetical protein OG455_41895 [Kitasatospora sp. NBC_01287]|uniref:hypothetical protein n=1 Tax=Kitasatospora sp. NBC_01287 TaxID=2903573 RepID=UPI00225BE5A8|nr:hypothetical protein [Kitasatospora sp. NBC_01287]MCX4751710.1 hypothetical protein [Kitasatospora sp. NBC_01287]MCX4751998.1 hypothetical protein [Kitasatospora sp. NBC_01287]